MGAAAAACEGGRGGTEPWLGWCRAAACCWLPCLLRIPAQQCESLFEVQCPVPA